MRAEQVLSRISHQRAMDVGSLSGRMVAIENPQSLTNINRISCQAGLLLQQQRRLDDPTIGNFVKTGMSHRLESYAAGAAHEPSIDSPVTRIEALQMRRHLSSLTYQTLQRIHSLERSEAVVLECEKRTKEKEERIRELNALLETAQSRHAMLSKADAAAEELSSKLLPVPALRVKVNQAEAEMKAKSQEHSRVQNVMLEIAKASSELREEMTSRLALLEALNKRIKTAATDDISGS